MCVKIFAKCCNLFISVFVLCLYSLNSLKCWLNSFSNINLFSFSCLCVRECVNLCLFYWFCKTHFLKEKKKDITKKKKKILINLLHFPLHLLQLHFNKSSFFSFLDLFVCVCLCVSQLCTYCNTKKKNQKNKKNETKLVSFRVAIAEHAIAIVSLFPLPSVNVFFLYIFVKTQKKKGKTNKETKKKGKISKLCKTKKNKRKKKCN